MMMTAMTMMVVLAMIMMMAVMVVVVHGVLDVNTYILLPVKQWL